MAEIPLTYDSDRADEFVRRTLHGKNLKPSFRLNPDGTTWDLAEKDRDAYIDAIIGFYDTWSTENHNVTNRAKATNHVAATIAWLRKNESDSEIQPLMPKDGSMRDFCLNIATRGAKKVFFGTKNQTSNEQANESSDPENVTLLIAKTIKCVDDKFRELFEKRRIEKGEAKLLAVLFGTQDIKLDDTQRALFLDAIRSRLQMRMASVDYTNRFRASTDDSVERGSQVVHEMLGTGSNRKQGPPTLRKIVRRDSFIDMYDGKMPPHASDISSFLDVLYPE